MKPALIPALLLSVSLSLLPRPAAADDKAAAGDNVKLTQEANRVRVEVGGKHFTDYYFAAEEKYPFVRPYMYPVHAADGTEVTNDQLRSGGDHPHHRSLYVAHGSVNGVDHWSLQAQLKGGKQPVQRHAGFDRVEGDTIVQKLEWEGADGRPMLRETRTVRFSALDAGSRAVDITSKFEPVDGPVTFEDTKEAGLCSVRVARAISDKSTITTAAGATGEKATWGKPAAWCDTSGQINGKPYGVAILDHPDNPRHPARWHVRGYGLMTANPFGLHDFDKGTPKGAGDMKLEPGKPVTFKYRVIVHEGDAKAAKIDEKFKAFAGK